MTVTATVQSGCSLTGGTLDFGTYTSGQSTAKDVTGKISFANCNGNLSFELDGGQSGNVDQRKMKAGNNTLAYQLFRNAARSNIFGTGARAQSYTLLVPGSGTLDVYGRIAANQVVPEGTYSDTVNITLTF